MSLKQRGPKLWVCLFANAASAFETDNHIAVESITVLQKQKEESNKKITALERQLHDTDEKIFY